MAILPSFEPGTNTFSFLLNMTNTSLDTIFAPVSVSIDTLTPPPPVPPFVEVDNADNGIRVEGAIFVYSDILGSDGKWEPGETTGNKLWKFKLSGVFNFTFFANVFGVLPPPASPVAKSGAGSNAPFVFVVSPENGTLAIHQGGPTSVPTTDPLPEAFGLQQNYPNPFNPETVIRYQLPQDSEVKLSIYNVLGREIRTLVSGKRDAGYHDATWDGRDNAGQQVATGVYIYRLRAGNFTEVKKLMLLR